MTRLSRYNSWMTGNRSPGVGAAVAIAASICAVLTSGCTVKQADTPSLSGPSELGTSIAVLANPDVLTQDGVSQSQVVIQARDEAGLPIGNMPLRVEINVGGTPVDFGRLSAKNLVTGTNGRTTVVYTAPAPPPEPVDTFTVVTLRIIPTGTNFASALPRTTNIRLVPPGNILPPNQPPVAQFRAPGAARVGAPVQFDALESFDPDGVVTTYEWSFGDGSRGEGSRPTHVYQLPDAYLVTLSVVDNRGARSATFEDFVDVLDAGAPVASIVASPEEPLVRETVFFNGSGSTAGQGRRIVSYEWDFGDGSSGTGAIVSHPYLAVGTFTIQLTVTDDHGQKGTTTTRITVDSTEAPTASFIVSPAIASVDETVFFNASASTAAAGHTIVSYDWDFGDGDTGTGVTASESYSAVGVYTVTLTVTDDLGKTGTSIGSVTVNAGQVPTADFVFSPVSPDVDQEVHFDASLSTAPPGRSIVSYSWNFGDGATATGRTTRHGFRRTGEFVVVLTVRDSDGSVATTSQNITVAAPGGLTADFSVSPDPATTGQVVQVDGSLSTPSTGATITSYSWNFGDPGSGSNAASARTATHTYNTAGTYTVTLTVRDSSGRTARATKTVTVEDQ